VAAIPTTTNSGEPFAGIVGIQRDITERKRAEEEVQRALEKERELNNLKSNFVSLTSHEFRTPLTTILSSAEMLEHYSARWTEERKLEHLQRIQTSVKYMTSLLDDVLVVAKAEANRLEFLPVPLDLLKFCRGLVEEFELMDKGKHTLRFDGEVDCAQVRMDEHLLRHILGNILSNALKYSPPGGSVQFDLTCKADQALFRIQDHGLGIPLEDQARLFETFHRASNVRNIAGTGLGLTIVKRSVDLHGGTIEINSQVDLGTTVTVSLPTGEENL
jgi:signal transduction histidine kinase